MCFLGYSIERPAVHELSLTATADLRFTEGGSARPFLRFPIGVVEMFPQEPDKSVTTTPSPWRRLRASSGAILSASALFVSQASAQSPSDRITDLESKLERSLQLIEALTKKVQSLETRSASAQASQSADTPLAVPAQDARITAVEAQVQQIATGLVTRSTGDEGVPLHGFADVGYAFRNKGKPKGANIGSVDFYLTPSISDRVKSLVELNFEVSDAGSVAADLERLQIGYAFSDQLTAWTGRFHTPYGYWNTAYHHGAQIQTSILRPRFLEFEDKGGILPAHMVGVWGTGAIRSDSGKLTYDLFAGNSPRIAIEGGAGSGVLNPNLASSTNHNASLGFNTGYEFGGKFDGLKIGLHGMQFRVGDDNTPANTTLVKFLGGYAVYVESDWEVLTEYYGFRNSDRTTDTGTHRSWAGYLQVGRSFGSWTPYGRFERTQLDQTDLYFSQQASGGSYDRNAVGLRYDLNRKTAVKFEFNRTKYTDRADTTYNEGRVQFAIRF